MCVGRVRGAAYAGLRLSVAEKLIVTDKRQRLEVMQDDPMRSHKTPKRVLHPIEAGCNMMCILSAQIGAWLVLKL